MNILRIVVCPSDFLVKKKLAEARSHAFATMAQIYDPIHNFQDKMHTRSIISSKCPMILLMFRVRSYEISILTNVRPSFQPVTRNSGMLENL